MMSKIENLKRIEESGIVAVVRAESPEGSFAVGVGSVLTAGAKKGDYDEVTRTAKEFIKKIRITRNKIS